MKYFVMKIMVCKTQYRINIFVLEEHNGVYNKQSLQCNDLSDQNLFELIKKLSMELYIICIKLWDIS